MENRVLSYKGIEYFKTDDYWIENITVVTFGRLHPPKRASLEINKILDNKFFREDKLKRILCQ